ncbi:PDR/VanB family oxidoreductase [Nitratireductor pacificus]|uniref:Phthalate 4,5-dioxygenase n=1 Tax=Nitratireductor pacificus pht-3B TaxID=391937 RepID=K2N0U8_9HYPH|nr:PDR/VanB family oxidoreductase [Nitratireductor pacificus]EKF17883.1 phthalate 4,5-dioxygenase [Nitratireductor pacificus pht-3B]
MNQAAIIPAKNADEQLSLRIERCVSVADGVVALTLAKADGGPLPGWSPGAHIDLILPNGVTRQYSLCGDPADTSRWRIGVLLAPASRGGSSYIHSELRAGDRLVASHPRNNFPLDPAERYLFIAGGIGITPILPMLAELSARGAEWHLLYGGRTARSMAFTDEIATLAGGTLELCPEDECGLLDLDACLTAHEPGRAVYCCGPEPLIEAVENRCASWPSGALRKERFAPSERQTPLDPGAFEVELARSGRRVVVPADRSMLSVLEDAGCAITNSCRAGICGTCLVRVLAGIPEHNDDILNDQQREAGDVVLPCVSRSRTATLVLDL